MRFSIIVPVYNVEKHLIRCIESILCQNFTDYELILVDDGSKDKSGDICDEYDKKYDRIRVIHQKNQGLSGARNTGLKVASGEWVIFIDSDDWIEPKMLHILSDYIDTEPADLYSYNMQKVDENDCVIEKVLYAVENQSMVFYGEEEKFEYFFDTFMQYKAGWEVCFRIFRRSIIKKYHLEFVSTKEVFAEDYLFSFQYLLHTDRIVSLCNIFYNYFQRSDSLLHVTDKANILPKLYRLSEYAYKEICASKMKYFRKNYDKLYFMLLNYHIQFLLADLTETQRQKNFEYMEHFKKHRSWMKKIMSQKDEYWTYTRIVRWL